MTVDFKCPMNPPLVLQVRKLSRNKTSHAVQGKLSTEQNQASAKKTKKKQVKTQKSRPRKKAKENPNRKGARGKHHIRRRTSILRPKRPEEHPFGVQQLANDCTLVDKSGYQKYGHPSSWHHVGRRGRSNIKCAPSLELPSPTARCFPDILRGE